MIAIGGVVDKPTSFDKLAFGKINPGYADWMQGERTTSVKIEFGTWWRLDATYWRVSWIEATGELCAVERKPSDRFVVICALTKKEVTDLMKKWFDGDNLAALFHRFNHDPAQEAH